MLLRAAWMTSIAVATGLRLWNALLGPVLHGYDGWGHVAYVLFIDLYHAIPYPDQGWSYFHPPLYYLLGAAVAQLGDGDVLARGLALIGSAASLAIAVLAARVVAMGRREATLDSAAACLAFTAVAFLPVHVYTSPMPGNEMLAAFFAAATLTAFLANELRDSRSHWLDVATGLLAGCALLTKVSALVPLAAIAIASLVRAARSPAPTAALRALLTRGALISATALLLASPYYARNIAVFGTPFVTSHEHPKVKAKELQQVPGDRSLRDFVVLPGLALLDESRFDAPHVVGSVWGSVYLNTWFDTYRASQFPRSSWPIGDYPIHGLTLGMAALGLIPTGFALLGALAMLRSALRDPDAIVDLTLSLTAIGSLAFFAAFATRIPTYAAVKASYLLALSLPYGWALARGVDSLRSAGAAGAGIGRLAPAAVGAVAVATTCVFATGVFHAPRPDHRDIHALRAHFGNASPARDWFDSPAANDRRHAIELLAAIEIAEGNPERARELLRRLGRGPLTPELVNALAVSTALSGGYGQAIQMWDEVLRGPSPAELMVNRGAVRAAMGDLGAARIDLQAAVVDAPGIEMAWHDLAWTERALGNDIAADIAAERALDLARDTPRGFPYGVGDGELDTAGRSQRWLLRIDGERSSPEISLYRPPRARYGQRARLP